MGATIGGDGSLVIVGANGETLVRRAAAAAFVSRPHPGGGDLAAVVTLADGLVVVGEDGVAGHRIDAGGE